MILKYAQTYEELATYLIQKAGEVKDSELKAAAAANRMVVVVSAVIAVIGIAFGIVIARLITRPLADLRDGVDKFSHGDLTVNLDSDGKDEIALMGHTLSEMAVALRRVIGAVNSASHSISETAHEFSAMAEETNASVEEFQASVDEMGGNLDSLSSSGEVVNASVEEVAAGAQATAERGTDIARKVDDAMNAGAAGLTAVQRATTSIDGVARNSHEATKAVQELGNNARQIQNFVTQIGGIADQTNLLALNAAIEAARAGEAGRGFAVVAEEVRKLAEDSNVAARSIAELASSITKDLDNVVTSSINNAKESEEARGLATETESTIQNMISYLRDIAGSTQDLAAVSEEQAASSEEIAETVQNMAGRIARTAEAEERIRHSVTEVAAASERVASGAESMAQLSGDLQDELTFFKLEEDGSSRSGRQRQVALHS